MSKDYTGALDLASTHLRDFPDSAALLSLASSALFSLGRFAEALEFLERAARIQPDSDVIRQGIERIRRRMERP